MKTNKKWVPYVLVSLSVFLLIVIFLIPVAQLVVYSFWETVPGSVLPNPTFTLENYYYLLVEEGPYYFSVYMRTLRLATMATAIIFVISYPIAWLTARTHGTLKSLLIILIMLPMISGAMIQTLGWIIMLSPLGVINGLLLSWGVIEQPIAFLGEELGVLIGLVQSYVPMMVLPLLTAMTSLNPYLEDASKSLGAGFFTTFFRVIFPLTLPGAIAGTMLVFLASLTSFNTPLLLGLGRVSVFGTVAYVQGIEIMNYPFASALSLFPMFILLIGLFIFKLFMKGYKKRMGMQTKEASS